MAVVLGSGGVSRWLRRRVAWSRRAAGLLALVVQGVVVGLVVVVGGVGVVGGCSRMRWALVPLMPKEEMAARRGRLRLGQGVFWVRMRTLPVFQSTWGVGWSTCKDLGSRPWWRAWIILMMPAAPAAAWGWPV